MNEILLDAVRHNNWATKRLVRFCQDQDLSAEQLQVRGVGTFGGILATLRHIITSDGSYVRRLGDAELGWVDSDEDTDLRELLVWASEAEQLWEQVLAKPIDVERVVIVDNGAHEVRAGIFVAQALNHANHHREQVCAILTGLGIQPPDLQAWEYAWDTGRIWDRG
ncbi:DinB family protein [Nonomuraea sp. CA-143628]|uniref:DinB family protein n=1 Tax=Nonomuraea sp. CA-143628 TaxID=3239997 RepID=UPI003D8F233D